MLNSRPWSVAEHHKCLNGDWNKCVLFVLFFFFLGGGGVKSNTDSWGYMRIPVLIIHTFIPPHP